MTEKKEKNRILGIRIDEDTFAAFERFCDQRQISKSEIARKAIMKYVHIIYNPEHNAKLIFSRAQLKHCLSCMNPQQIATLVDISVSEGSEDMTLLETIVEKAPFEDPAKKEIDFQFKTLLRFVFSPEGENWFDEISYHWEGETIKLIGTHCMGENFSIYIRELMQNYALIHGFGLINDIFARRKENGQLFYTIELHFSKTKK